MNFYNCFLHTLVKRTYGSEIAKNDQESRKKIENSIKDKILFQALAGSSVIPFMILAHSYKLNPDPVFFFKMKFCRFFLSSAKVATASVFFGFMVGIRIWSDCERAVDEVIKEK